MNRVHPVGLESEMEENKTNRIACVGKATFEEWTHRQRYLDVVAK